MLFSTTLRSWASVASKNSRGTLSTGEKWMFRSRDFANSMVWSMCWKVSLVITERRSSSIPFFVACSMFVFTFSKAFTPRVLLKSSLLLTSKDTAKASTCFWRASMFLSIRMPLVTIPVKVPMSFWENFRSSPMSSRRRGSPPVKLVMEHPRS